MKHCLKYNVVALIVLLPFLLADCYTEGIKFRLTGTDLRFEEEVVLSAFSSYLQAISSESFAIESFYSQPDLYRESSYLEQLVEDQDFQFFPAVLWQLHEIDNKSISKEIAEKYSQNLYQQDVVDKISFFEALHSLYLTRFLIDSCERSGSLLVNILSQHISKNEDLLVQVCGGTRRSCIERLLENRALFLASDLTGDPAYALLAQQYSELVFQHFLVQGDFRELYQDLADIHSNLISAKIEQLDARDLHDLSLIFYGFSILDSHLDNERYHQACVRLASLFEFIFNDFDSANSAVNPGVMHADKMKIISKTWVCLAFNRLDYESEPGYREVAEVIFNEILDELQQPLNKDEIYSSRLYYYLFEFLKQTA